MYIVLKVIDALRNDDGFRLGILEIGVWKGAWSETILRNRDNTYVVGVDPYPGEIFQEPKRIALDCMEDLISSERFRLIDTYENLDLTFDLIHIDGKHTEDCVEKDLVFARDHANRNSVIVVDDFRDPYFPGVANSMYKFLSQNDFKVFLMSENKAYICKTENHDILYKYLYNQILLENVINIKKHYVGPSPSFIQEANINGFPVLLCVD
jgi:hypothetical protein